MRAPTGCRAMLKGRNMHHSNSSSAVSLSTNAVKRPTADRRSRRRRRRLQPRRSHLGTQGGGGGGRGELPVRSPEVTARLRAEGVPDSEIPTVAAEIAHCIRL